MSADASLYFVNLLIVSAVFLPLHWLIRNVAARQSLSIVLGLYMVFIAGPRFLFFWIPFWLAMWVCARLVGQLKDGPARSYCFLAGIVAALTPLVLWKIYPESFVIELDRALRGVISDWLPALRSIDRAIPALAPLGLSFTTFRALDLLIGAYLDSTPKLRLREALFSGFFPPVLLVGPIIQFDEIARRPAADPAEPIAESIWNGGARILTGLIKIYVLALPLAGSEAALNAYGESGTLALWKQTLFYAWFLYLNFAGFSDLAIGCARLYGYRVRENFNYPYFRRNLQEFWANWHMSLTGFAQRNVFVALGGYRRNRQYAAIVATMMVIALWHGLTWSLVVFGLIHGIAMAVLRARAQRANSQAAPGPVARAVSIAATFLFVAATIPLLLLAPEDLPGFYGRLFGVR